LYPLLPGRRGGPPSQKTVKVKALFVVHQKEAKGKPKRGMSKRAPGAFCRKGGVLGRERLSRKRGTARCRWAVELQERRPKIPPTPPHPNPKKPTPPTTPKKVIDPAKKGPVGVRRCAGEGEIHPGEYRGSRLTSKTRRNGGRFLGGAEPHYLLNSTQKGRYVKGILGGGGCGGRMWADA